MKSLDRNFLEEQSIPLEFAGTLRVLGEYRGKQELFTRQTPQVLNTLKQIAIVQSTGILIEAYKDFEDRVGIVRASRGAKTVWVQEAIKNLPQQFKVSELIRACPGVSRPMIRVILEALRKEGKLEVVGTGRGAMWRKR
jgi:hypothetical protein